jgi:hypothetical protein
MVLTSFRSEIFKNLMPCFTNLHYITKSVGSSNTFNPATARSEVPKLLLFIFICHTEDIVGK